KPPKKSSSTSDKPKDKAIFPRRDDVNPEHWDNDCPGPKSDPERAAKIKEQAAKAKAYFVGFFDSDSDSSDTSDSDSEDSESLDW
ncbi:hypothetical protein FRC11_012211, partial [Ceratobasidium sp. 423]